MVAQGEGQHPSHAIHPILDPRFQPYTRFLVHAHHMAHGVAFPFSHIPIIWIALNLHLLIPHGLPRLPLT